MGFFCANQVFSKLHHRHLQVLVQTRALLGACLRSQNYSLKVLLCMHIAFPYTMHVPVNLTWAKNMG